MSDETSETTAEETEKPQKKKGISVLMIIILAVMVWAVIFYFMTLRQSQEAQQTSAPPAASQPVEQDAVPSAPVQQGETTMTTDTVAEDAPAKSEAPVSGTEKAAKAAALTEEQAMQEIMSLFGDGGK